MRHAKLMLTALTLFVTSLSVPGCAGTQPRADISPKSSAKKNLNDSEIGRLEDPTFLFDKRLKTDTNSLKVKAMAYTGACSVKNTRRTAKGAWGDRLTEESRAVAISPDLMDMGLDRGDVIHIEGLPGDYKVLDIMNSRHSKSIDIFYGDDQCGAREWGKRTLTITWQ